MCENITLMKTIDLTLLKECLCLRIPYKIALVCTGYVKKLANVLLSLFSLKIKEKEICYLPIADPDSHQSKY